MALWHLYRMETDTGGGPVSLTCDEGEGPIKFTLYDSEGQVYSTTTACVAVDATPDDITTMLREAGYDPSDWHPA